MSKHVLTVDDEAGIRRLVQLNLERAGYRVSTAIDGVDGLDKVAAELPDLVILDITMPRMDGFEFLRQLKSKPEFAAIKVICLTARSRDEDVFHSQRAGADLYLPKPFSPIQLLQAVKEVFREPAEGASGG